MPEYWYEEWTDRNRVKRRVEITIDSVPKPLWLVDNPEQYLFGHRPCEYMIWLEYSADGKSDGRASHGTYDTYNEALEVIHKDFPRAIKDWR